ncbi:MAG: lysophospholipid acyltransferase family protein [Lentisphaeria bacterium]|nr:lysophospholipid acyltransferase family protein [Lentisphaeria bacterium]
MKKFFKKFRETALGRFTALGLISFISVLIRLWRRTLRVDIVDDSGVLKNQCADGMVIVFWHNRLAFVPPFFPKKMRRRTAAITSASRDGEYADILVRQFIGATVRGSSSKGGGKAMLEVKSLLKKNWTIAISIDGPRGPRYQIKPGAALLAKRMRAPVFAVSINAPNRWEMGGWDRLQIPKPFSKVQFRLSELVNIPPDCDLRTEAVARIQNALDKITDDRRS